MLSTAEALATLLSAASPIAGTESIPTLEALNRVLSADVVSPLDVPPMNTSSMDGYACARPIWRAHRHSAACRCRSAFRPATRPSRSKPGTAARIFTGATVPPGADAIVMQEQTEPTGDEVTILAQPRHAGEWITRARRGHPQRLGDPARRHAADAAGAGTRRLGRLRRARGARAA